MKSISATQRWLSLSFFLPNKYAPYTRSDILAITRTYNLFSYTRAYNSFSPPMRLSLTLSLTHTHTRARARVHTRARTHTQRRAYSHAPFLPRLSRTLTFHPLAFAILHHLARFSLPFTWTRSRIYCYGMYANTCIHATRATYHSVRDERLHIRVQNARICEC